MVSHTTLYGNFLHRLLVREAKSERGLAFISFGMPVRVCRQILVLVSYFGQFYPYLPDYKANSPFHS